MSEGMKKLRSPRLPLWLDIYCCVAMIVFVSGFLLYYALMALGMTPLLAMHIWGRTTDPGILTIWTGGILIMIGFCLMLLFERR